jgi:hypothetical protein
MKAAPPKFAEAAVGFLIPPACREEVLGDLHERYTGLGQYILDAVRTAPLVILSRIRRTTDPQVFLLEALVLYLSFLGAAWYFDRKSLADPWGLLRLAIPAAVALVVVMLADAYANRETRAPLKTIRGTTLVIGVVCLSQAVLPVGNPDWAVPRRTILGGCYTGLLLVLSVRMLFPPLVHRPQSANGLGFGQKQAGKAVNIWSRTVVVILCAAMLVLIPAFGVEPGFIAFTLLGVYQLGKRF